MSIDNLREYLDKDWKPASISNGLTSLNLYVASYTDQYAKRYIEDKIPNGGIILREFGTDEGVYAVECRMEARLYNDFLKHLKSNALHYVTMFAEFEKPMFFKSVESNFEDSSLGLIYFSLSYSISEFSSQGYKKQETKSNLADNASKGEKSIFDSIENFINYYKTGRNYVRTATALIAQGLDIIKQVALEIQSIESDFNALSNQIASIQSTIINTVTSPILLYNSAKNLIDTLVNSTNQIIAIPSIVGTAYSFSPKIVNTSSQYLQNITTTENQINSLYAGLCITSYAKLIAQKEIYFDYEIEEQLANIKTLQTTITNFNDIALKQQLNTLLSTIVVYLNEKKYTTVNKKSLVVNYPTSAYNLCYKIYGNVDNYQTFLQWNENVFKDTIYCEPLQPIEIIYYEM